jgi:hypothetical protein
MRLNELEEEIKIPDVFKKEIGKLKAKGEIKATDQKPFGGMSLPGTPGMQDLMPNMDRITRKSITSKKYK